MRRPLFGTGIPKRALFDDGLITVFNTTVFTPNAQSPQVFAVTLYAWAWQNVAPFTAHPTYLPTLVVTLETDGAVAPPALTQWLAGDFHNYELASVVARPVKLLDRVVVRGDQQLYLSNLNTNCSVANGMFCFIYGYFEMAGEDDHAEPFRPLQPPGPLFAPFSGTPTELVLAQSAAGAYATAHQLTNAYLDDLTFKANVGGGEPTPEAISDAVAFLRLPGGVKLPLPVNGTNPLQASEVFDGIPMIAPSAMDSLVEIGFDTTSSAGKVAAVAYGSFNRH